MFMIKLKNLLKEDVDLPPPPPAIVRKVPSIDVNKIADAIYVAEGGDKTRYPYGISVKKSGIQTKGKEDARRICINTINHAYRDWVSAGHKGDFIDFLSKRYCEKPEHWAKMVKSIMARQAKKK